MENEKKKEKELELIQVTSDKVDDSACGPETCPWNQCPGR